MKKRSLEFSQPKEIMMTKTIELDVTAERSLRAAEMEQRVEGWRSYKQEKNGAVFKFENTPANVRLFRSLFPEYADEVLKSYGIGAPPKPKGKPQDSFGYVSATTPYAHQTRALEAARTQDNFALFLEQGTGKTKVAIDRCGEMYCAGDIDRVLVLTKKGIHNQWADQQIPLHLGKDVRRTIHCWGNKKSFSAQPAGTMFWLTMNIDAINTVPGKEAAERFLRGGKAMMIIDESHIIKSPAAKRTKVAIELGSLARYRMIMTGTPIAKNLVDQFAQFKFLDENILGYRYLTSFRNQYCLMGGFEGRVVVGHKNLDEFKAKVAPYSFRVTKEEELDLPPKNYAEVPFEMTPEMKKHYRELSLDMMTKLEDGAVLDVQHAITLLLRLQQITSGLLTDGQTKVQLSNPRLDTLLDLLEQREGKAVIWTRFNHDVEQISAALKERCVTFHGGTSAADRKKNVEAFLAKGSGIDYFVSNPSAGGTGLNLQGECRTAIFYTNNFNAIDRWQAEDRIHRIGATGVVTYFDLTCIGSMDRKILRNLRAKKSISDLALSDIKGLIAHE